MGELQSTITDTALIFEGGGMRASYTSAVVCALLNAGICLDWVAGISAGSSCTANYISRDAPRAKASFVDFVADPQFGGLRTMLHGQGWFNAHYIYEQTGRADQALPFDWQTFRNNPARANFGAFRVDTGEQQWFTKADTPTMDALMTRVRASSTMPGLMPMVHINGLDYVDGALGPSGGIPLDRAKDAGFTKFLVILTRERSYRKEPETSTQARLYRRLFHRYPAVIDALKNRHLGYNATRDELFELERQGKAYLFVPDHMSVGNSERNIAKLQASFDAGRAQINRELPAIKEFLG